jgi:hypothetical protein
MMNQRLAAVGMMVAALLGGAHLASAQGELIVNPSTLPDVGVTVIAPSPVPAYDTSYVTVKIDSQAPAAGFYYRGAYNTVNVVVDFTRLTPVYVWVDSGLTCTSSYDAAQAWNVVRCSGSLPWGVTATMYVWFQPMTAFYCGTPTYVDAGITMSGRERSSANNRSIARIDTTGCIN